MASKKFNLDEYETVKERKAKFYKDFPDGRIVVKNISPEPLVYAMFEAKVYISREDHINNIPRATGYALELRDTEQKVSKSGYTYEGVNYTSWTENCEESAVGRALDNAGYSTKKQPSREEMEKVIRMEEKMKKFNDKQKELIFRVEKLPLNQTEKQEFIKIIAKGEKLQYVEKQIEDREKIYTQNVETIKKRIEKGWMILGYDEEKKKKINKTFTHLEDYKQSNNLKNLEALLKHLHDLAKMQGWKK